MAKEYLIEVVEGLGFDHVSTFIASGNVLFDPGDDRGDDGRETARRIAAALEARLGYAVPTTIRTGPELTAIAEYEPFPATVVAERGKPQVMLLFEQASKRTMAEVLAMQGPDDLLAFGDGGRELHWLPNAGILGADLDLDGITDLVGTNTMRTLNTVRRLVPKL